ncbi:sperm acrosome membrane-associated protein 6 precursor [Mus musculus]|uniref:Sperm acrosome membrane-associated protein 6 n=3 Tax=Mus musculus TaxID=10090 RepID=SACA6_MOUSE|nr:sperm acrosome membrane-associated protein 6 precursor [Mus musculus]E9Q8Q8.1 RecName: Full=Sperm acrosome membrane-associated protein 6; Flags: Precursor [Mus musculus]|eukprot:NP_001156381.1 sperm acrosome membrane-associated protein 6 precursor [Mus musculus]
MTSQRSLSSPQTRRPSVMGLISLVGSIVLLFLLIFRASTWACLFCFTTYEERLRVCQLFVGREETKINLCRNELEGAFEDLKDMKINYDERSYLHDEFTQMTVSLQEKAARRREPFWLAFKDAAAKLKRTIEHLKKAPACIPPCGLQEVARLFHCSGCFSKLCDLPLDCPVQDMLVNRGDQALFSCIVAFELPESEITYSWKFVGGVRTKDVTYFRDMPGAHGYLARIRPVQPKHGGTFSCVILHDQRPLARLYFYLNVTGPPPPEDTELQVTFREVMNRTPAEPEMIQPWSPSLGELLTNPQALTLGNLFLLAATAALGSASVTLLVWLFFRWYLSGN